ncbi:hypothetical protein L1987_47158 [Smallanthus sonchifolius]|uniref:Uncharacterized protein n=1 Tax=Smallanthus sonchifolius TaxID=185202 RepID=A0ACB9G2E6_9ASTR|nr:hypothetical protein L1987_47158 [Smallanthus sonchifolius]
MSLVMIMGVAALKILPSLSIWQRTGLETHYRLQQSMEIRSSKWKKEEEQVSFLTLSNQEEDNYDVLWPFSSTYTRKPTRRRRIFGSQRNKNATNPYGDRGLDKFEALLADLDQKTQKILTGIGSDQYVSMVKSIYRSSNEIEPIVIKLQDQTKHHNMSSLSTPEYLDHEKDVSFIKRINNRCNEAKEVNTKVVDEPTQKIRSDQCKRKIVEWWKPRYHFALFVILILLLFSGRSFAISIGCMSWTKVGSLDVPKS